MNQVKFLTPSQVKLYVTEINQDIADTLVNNAILMVQESLLKPTFGQEWFDELIVQCSGNTSGSTYTAPNLYIMQNYGYWLLSYGVWQYLATTLSLQLNSAGVRVKTSDHSVAGESKDIAFYRTFIENYIDNVRKTMKRYIDLHKTDYPLYYNNTYHDKPSKDIYNFKIGKV